MPFVIGDSKMNSGPILDARTRRAEREGFEPSIRVSTYAGLANRCLQPLGHLSRRASEVIGGERLLQPFAHHAPVSLFDRCASLRRAGEKVCTRASIWDA